MDVGSGGRGAVPGFLNKVFFVLFLLFFTLFCYFSDWCLSFDAKLPLYLLCSFYVLLYPASLRDMIQKVPKKETFFHSEYSIAMQQEARFSKQKTTTKPKPTQG